MALHTAQETFPAEHELSLKATSKNKRDRKADASDTRMFYFFFFFAPNFLGCMRCRVLDCYAVLRPPLQNRSNAKTIFRNATEAPRPQPGID